MNPSTEINEPVFATGLTTENVEPTSVNKIKEASIEELETTVAESLDKAGYRPRNRAERRRIAKKLGKKGRANIGTVSETAKKLSYINLIQDLRKLNEKKENEENEATEDGNTDI